MLILAGYFTFGRALLLFNIMKVLRDILNADSHTQCSLNFNNFVGLTDEAFSDVTVEVSCNISTDVNDKQTYKLHRAVLAGE